ncbi:MAG: toll/interleukin-1 receptor domain-containing protein [Patescibacteria group bacterium]
MKLRDRRYNLVFDHVKDYLLDSDRDIGVMITAEHVQKEVKAKWPEMSDEEIIYGLRQLAGKGYLAPYSQNHDDQSVFKLTQKGMDEWLFPMGGVDSRKIFLSYSTIDKAMATGIKQGLEGLGFYVFMAPEEIQGGAKWRDVIISNLTTCSTFVSLRTKKYAQSPASEQECGFALAMGKRILSLCVGTSPSEMGFCAEYQGEPFDPIPDPVPLIVEYCKKQLQ